jgi:8-oxo-dGTP diphosphatase
VGWTACNVPSGSSARKPVVAAVIRRGDRFLLGRRSLHKRSAPGYWCPVSGSVEPGETLEAAVVRECFEEVGLRVVVKRKVAICDTRDGSAEIHWFLVWDEGWGGGESLPDPYLANDEHSELGWFTAEEMRGLSPFFWEDYEIFARL